MEKIKFCLFPRNLKHIESTCVHLNSNNLFSHWTRGKFFYRFSFFKHINSLLQFTFNGFYEKRLDWTLGNYKNKKYSIERIFFIISCSLFEFQFFFLTCELREESEELVILFLLPNITAPLLTSKC